MKTLLAATAMLAALATPALAEGAKSKAEFVAAYDFIVNGGINKGASSNKTCNDVKCDHTMTFHDGGAWLNLIRRVYHSGNETVIVCREEDNYPNNDGCADSDGHMWLEHFNGSKWTLTQTLANAWTDTSF